MGQLKAHLAVRSAAHPVAGSAAHSVARPWHLACWGLHLEAEEKTVAWVSGAALATLGNQPVTFQTHRLVLNLHPCPLPLQFRSLHLELMRWRPPYRWQGWCPMRVALAPLTLQLILPSLRLDQSYRAACLAACLAACRVACRAACRAAFVASCRVACLDARLASCQAASPTLVAAFLAAFLAASAAFQAACPDAACQAACPAAACPAACPAASACLAAYLLPFAWPDVVEFHQEIVVPYLASAAP
mmetsp:Transcript_94830/g.164584  ORF Transcript_94830/g.164584 Transcript_94830/m.164584 type:complete len:246 (+) Transcript_94830:1292-2029(+)